MQQREAPSAVVGPAWRRASGGGDRDLRRQRRQPGLARVQDRRREGLDRRHSGRGSQLVYRENKQRNLNIPVVLYCTYNVCTRPLSDWQPGHHELHVSDHRPDLLRAGPRRHRPPLPRAWQRRDGSLRGCLERHFKYNCFFFAIVRRFIV